ncbi:MAG: PKD domain-containing protein [Bacteroidota bacterium]
MQASIEGVPRDTSGCIPLTVDFTDTVANAKTYEWTFGDGTPTAITSVPNISHTYTTVGTYTVMLVSVDSSTCNMRDTVYKHIRAGDKRAIIALNFLNRTPAILLNIDSTTFLLHRPVCHLMISLLSGHSAMVPPRILRVRLLFFTIILHREVIM